MKFWANAYICLLLIFVSACADAAPTATVEPPPSPAPTTPVPTETSPPPATETAVAVPPSPTATPAPTATVETPAHPGPRTIGDMVFHEGLGMVVMLNGTAGDNRLWGWDGAWQVVGESGPDGRTLGGVVYDPVRDRLVVYGGYSLASDQCQYDTWEWDGQTWQQLDVASPEVCSHFVMEYDPSREKVILFGGADEQQNPYPGMWTWDGRQWEKLEIETPEVRFHTMSASDTNHNKLYLLGGFDGNYQILDEFWAWNGTTWEQLIVPRPTALSHARMAFDTGHKQLLLFGGSTRARLPLDLQDDTWVLTGDIWRQVTGPAPSPRGGPAMAYDPIRDKVVLVGGFDANDQGLADTWEWDGARWTCVDSCESDQETISPPAFGPEVALFRGDTHRAGNYNFPVIREQPDLVWQADTGLTYLENLLLHEGVLYAGGSNGKLYAFDALTGEELWQGGDFRTAVSAVAITGDVIVMGGFNPFIQALDRRTGEVVWTTETDGRTLAPPLILADRVYASATNNFYALNLQTGEVLWTVPLPSDNEFDFVSAPAYEAGTLFMSVGQTFLALDSETGETHWQNTKDTYFYFSAIDQSQAYVGNGDGFFYAYDLATGEEVWKFEGGSEVWLGPAVTEDTVYVGDFNGFIYALDARTGEKRWEFETDNSAVSDAVISNGLAYFSDCNHDAPLQACHLYALDAETGAQLWEYTATGTLLSTPALGEDGIYVVLSASVLALK